MGNNQITVFQLFGKIDPQAVHRLVEQMHPLLKGDDVERESFQPVLCITSPGGHIESSLQIYSFLTQIPGLVTIACGLVESAAPIIYLAGSKRLATPKSMFFFHEWETNMSAGMSGLLNACKNTLSREKLGLSILCENSKVPLKTARRWFRKGHTMSAEEAKKWGIVHEIIDKPYVLGKNVMAYGNPF